MVLVVRCHCQVLVHFLRSFMDGVVHGVVCRPPWAAVSVSRGPRGPRAEVAEQCPLPREVDGPSERSSYHRWHKWDHSPHKKSLLFACYRSRSINTTALMTIVFTLSWMFYSISLLWRPPSDNVSTSVRLSVLTRHILCEVSGNSRGVTVTVISKKGFSFLILLKFACGVTVDAAVANIRFSNVSLGLYPKQENPNLTLKSQFQCYDKS